MQKINRHNIFKNKIRYLAAAIPALWVAGCGSGTAGSSNSNVSTTCAPCTMFFAGNNGQGYNAGLKGQAITLGADASITGIQGADYICQTEAKNALWHPNIPSGNTHTYKAMIVDGINRIACTSPNCGSNGESENLNWVLQPLTLYISESGNTIETTNESGIFTVNPTISFAQGSTSGQLMPAIYLKSKNKFVYGQYNWSGLKANWTTNGSFNCGKWTAPSANANDGTTGFQRSLSYTRNSTYAHTDTNTNISQLIDLSQIKCSFSQRNVSNSFTTPNQKGTVYAATNGLICVEQG